MKNTFIKSKKGFTIIEVVLVLAIAGLIFLMVFVALPNLQRTQRDTQRRNDVDRVSTALTQYITNNSSLPGFTGATFKGDSFRTEFTSAPSDPWKKFVWNYLLASGSDTFLDPNGGGYGFVASQCTTSGNVNTCTSASLTNNFGYLDSSNQNINSGVVVVMVSASCSGQENAPFQKNEGNRKFAVAMKLEGNGVYCIDNS